MGGPAPPWSLAEFQRLSGFNDIWRGAAFMCLFEDMEQRHTTGMLTNIQGLRRSTYPGWPLFKEANDNLHHKGPLPKVCLCSLVHKDPINGTIGSFLSASSFSLFFSFWSRLFRDAWCSGHGTPWDGEQCLKPNSAATVSLSSATGSWQSLYTVWNQGQLTRAVLREYAPTQDVDRFLSSPVALTLALSTRSQVASACTLSSSLPQSTSSPPLDTPLAFTPSTKSYSGHSLATGYASSSRPSILSTSTSSGLRSSPTAPLVSG